MKGDIQMRDKDLNSMDEEEPILDDEEYIDLGGEEEEDEYAEFRADFDDD